LRWSSGFCLAQLKVLILLGLQNANQNHLASDWLQQPVLLVILLVTLVNPKTCLA